ncbi:hypothetical protein [Methylomonas sp. AM2-LC]|uniref:hypothetical protein n=1 Tax=Methylomonas sp. AM2-LC TaxID=3153301 RepID=UPI0032643F3F
MDELLNTAACGFQSQSNDSIALMANQTLEKTFGYAVGALVGKHIHSILLVSSRFYSSHIYCRKQCHPSGKSRFIASKCRSD